MTVTEYLLLFFAISVVTLFLSCLVGVFVNHPTTRCWIAVFIKLSLIGVVLSCAAFLGATVAVYVELAR